MSCAGCNTSAIQLNENILPTIVVVVFIIIYMLIRSKNNLLESRMTKKGIFIYWVFFWLFFVIAVQLSPVEWFDINIYSERM